MDRSERCRGVQKERNARTRASATIFQFARTRACYFYSRALASAARACAISLVRVRAIRFHRGFARVRAAPFSRKSLYYPFSLARARAGLLCARTRASVGLKPCKFCLFRSLPCELLLWRARSRSYACERFSSSFLSLARVCASMSPFSKYSWAFALIARTSALLHTWHAPCSR